MYETPSTEVITWQENPVNITCVARSIPNATIEWWFQDRLLESGSRGFTISGNGPISVLNIEKPAEQYYGSYRCKAKNTLGENETRITLKEVCKYFHILFFPLFTLYSNVSQPFCTHNLIL